MSEEETHDQKQVLITTENSGNALDNSMTENRRVVDITEDTNLTTANINNDIRAVKSPISGYSEESLLSLVEACAPLVSILHNLSFYVQMALTETPKEPSDGLTIDESAAIRLYTIEWEKPHKSLSSILNDTLKNKDRENVRPYFKYMKLFLTALIKLPCIPPLTIWRGLTKNVNAEYESGTPVTWWTFSSCTTDLPMLEKNKYFGNTGSRTLFSVETINGRSIRNHSHVATDDEILLLPGTHMIVQSQFSPVPNLHIIHLRQVIPEEVLLEPPFKDAYLYPTVKKT